MYTYMCVCIYTYTLIPVCKYIYIQVYTYTHIHTCPYVTTTHVIMWHTYTRGQHPVKSEKIQNYHYPTTFPSVKNKPLRQQQVP